MLFVEKSPCFSKYVFHVKDVDVFPAQLQEAFRRHGVQCPRHVQAALAYLCGERLHPYADVFLACRILAVVADEAYDLLTDGMGVGAPREVGATLGLGADDVEQAGAEKFKGAEKAVGLFLADGQGVARVGGGDECHAVSLRQSEKTFWLEEGGGGYLFSYFRQMVVGGADGGDFAFGEEHQFATWLTLLDEYVVALVA